MSAARSNLALRVGSAVLLFPLLVWLTWLGGLPFTALLMVAAAVAALELTSMFAPVGVPEGFGVAVAALLPLTPWWAENRGPAHAYAPAIPFLLAVAVVALLVLHLTRPGPVDKTPQRVAATALAWLYCGLLVATVGGVRVRFGFGWVMLAFVVTWANDTLAYFAGRFFGRHLLFPRISPKKTWEGFAGGVAGSVLGAVGAAALFERMPLPAGETFRLPPGWAVALGLGASVLGPLGDLCESMLKRAAGVKDSGRLIPGHGGLLDRIDALLFVAPWVYAWAALAN